MTALTQAGYTERKHVRSHTVLLPLNLVTLLTVCRYRNRTDTCSCLHVKLLFDTMHGAKIKQPCICIFQWLNKEIVFSAIHRIKKTVLCNTSGFEVRHFLSPLCHKSENLKLYSLKQRNEEFVLRNGVPLGHKPHDFVLLRFTPSCCFFSLPNTKCYPLV